MRTTLFVAVCVTVWSFAITALPVSAQSVGAITGRVTSATTGLPVVGANVEIEALRRGALADADGRYRIDNVPAGDHTVAVRHIGYTPVTLNVAVTAGSAATANFTVQVAPIALDELVVTGAAGGERLRTVGNSVAKINAVEAVALGAPPTITSLLNARAPGLIVNFSTGRLGAGQSINIRGRSSIGLGNSPLIYVDGVRINSATGQGPGGSGGFAVQNASVASRLNDITPGDIESIEIIKGPAAATIYGTEASSGVIQIITKKGVPGAKPVFTLQAQQGTIWFRNPEGRLPKNYQRDPATGELVVWDPVGQEKARGTPLFRNGHTQVLDGSASGGFQQARYYLSSSYENSDGVEPNNGLKQFSMHANVNVTPNDKLDIGTSIHFVDLRSRLGTDGGASTMYTTIGGHILAFPNSRGFVVGPPEISWELWDNIQNVKRFTASSTLNLRATDWLTQRLLAGLDYTGDDSRALERFAPPHLRVFTFLTPTNAAGRIAQRLNNSTRFSLDYSGTARANLTTALSASTSVGLQTFRTEASASSLGGIGFPGAGVETVQGTATALTATQSSSINTTVGAYVQEKLAFRDRLFLTGAVRVDNNSAFGEDFKWVTYPKLDVSWVASDEPFWAWGNVVNTLRLRAAYGESGRAPNAFAALRTFSPTQGPGGTNAVTPGNLGNPDLRPERGKEFEVGFEAQILDRLSVDFTYFTKKTVDQIVNQSVAPSSGFAGSVPLNLARVDNSGIELQATIQALDREDLQWTVTGNIATNNDVIKDLGVVPGAIASPGQSNRVGYPISGWWSKRVASADRDPVTGRAINVLCDGGAGNAPMPCASAPFVFIGPSIPTSSGAVSTTLTVRKRVRLYGLVDFQRGNRAFNANELLRCGAGFGPLLCEANYRPEKYSPLYLAETGNYVAHITAGTIDQFFQDASYFKLREVSATYMVPERYLGGLSAASITISARELATWTDYGGIDPDMSDTNDQALLPTLSRLTAILNIRF